MLEIARHKIRKITEKSDGRGPIPYKITLEMKSAAELDGFPAESFDAVVAVLVFSELYPAERLYVLEQIMRILKPGGTFIPADEIIPSNPLKRLIHSVISGPLRLITFIKTQQTTKPLKKPVALLKKFGFDIKGIYRYRLGAFGIFHSVKPKESGYKGSFGKETDLTTERMIKGTVTPPENGSVVPICSHRI